MNTGTIVISSTTKTDLPAGVTDSGTRRFSILASDGNTVVQTADISGASWSVSGLPDGDYFATVAALDSSAAQNVIGKPVVVPFTAPTPLVQFDAPAALSISFVAQ